MSKTLFLLIFLASMFSSYAQVEKVQTLQTNPQLYHKKMQLQQQAAAKRQIAPEAFFIIPNTLTLPFVDDFSKYHLKSYDPGNFNIIDTINRNVSLTSDTEVISYMLDTSWKYVFNTGTQTIDSFPKDPIQFILNNDPSYLHIPTQTLTGWPTYYNKYTFDNSGNAIDSSFVIPDTLIYYSFYYGITDTNALWLDNQVYVNDNYPLNKISYGVATFDGLDEFGLPHNRNSLITQGPADTLTSQYINLENLLPGDSVFLSFSYQRKGLGDKPEPEDSLILEFKVSGNSWRQEWSAAGSSGVINNPQFENVLVNQITDPFYLTNDFQFRFRNKATVTGNNDHWHIDYVYLNKDRGINDTRVNDIAVVSPLNSFLNDYTSMPWNHYAADPARYTSDSITGIYRNNYNSTQPMDFGFSVYEGFTNDPIYNEPPGITLNFPAQSNYVRTFSTDLFLPYTPATTDSVLINLEFSLTENQTGFTTENNTVTTSVLFDNYFAYDDGTAERAYGLEGPGLKKFAYEFNLSQPDTLRAVQFHFSQINDNLSSAQISLAVWREILSEEDTLYYREEVPIFYVEERYGLALYRLDPPVPVENKFYVGWEQIFTESIQLGLDLNNDATEHMYFYADGSWKSSDPQINGAPMIRAVVGKFEPLIGTDIKSPMAKGDAFIYPNPSDNLLYIKMPEPAERMEIYDVQGKLVRTLSGAVTQIDIAGMNKGVYLLRIISEERAPQTLRFVKL